MRNYPDDAMSRGIQGYSVLCCTPRANRRYDCDVAFEAPRDRGFGLASLRVAEEFRLSESSYAAYQQTARTPVRVALHWRIEGHESEAFDTAIQNAGAVTADICEPQTAVSPPAN